MSIPSTHGSPPGLCHGGVSAPQHPWEPLGAVYGGGLSPTAPTLDGAGGQAAPAVSVRQLCPLVGELGGAPAAVAPQQDAAALDLLPLDPALRGNRFLCGDRDPVTMGPAGTAGNGTRGGGGDTDPAR